MPDRTPVFAVQITNRDDAEIRLTVDALESLGYEWINFGMIPFTTEVTNLEAFPTDRRVIPLAGTKILELLTKGCLPPNWRIWYDDLIMDQFFTSRDLKDFMLNADSRMVDFRDALDMTFPSERFIKPSDDGKSFAGMLLTAGTSLRQALENITHREIASYETIMVSPVKQINREFRCVVLRNKVIATSEYRSAAGIKAKVVDKIIEQSLEDFIYELPVNIDLACVDVCELLDADGSVKCWKIVEINCFHCSGMYKIDRAHVYKSIVEAVRDHRL